MAGTEAMHPTAISLNNFLYDLTVARAAHIAQMKPRVVDFFNNREKAEPGKPSDSKPSDGKKAEPAPATPGPSTPGPSEPEKPTGGGDSNMSAKIKAERASFFAKLKADGKTYPFENVEFKSEAELSRIPENDRAKILSSFINVDSAKLLGKLKLLVSFLPFEAKGAEVFLPDYEGKHGLEAMGYSIARQKNKELYNQKAWFRDLMDLFRITHPNFLRAGETYAYLADKLPSSDVKSGDMFQSSVDDDMLEASKNLLEMFNNSSY